MAAEEEEAATMKMLAEEGESATQEERGRGAQQHTCSQEHALSCDFYRVRTCVRNA